MVNYFNRYFDGFLDLGTLRQGIFAGPNGSGMVVISGLMTSIKITANFSCTIHK
jgi:hypothetical protein